MEADRFIENSIIKGLDEENEKEGIKYKKYSNYFYYSWQSLAVTLNQHCRITPGKS